MQTLGSNALGESPCLVVKGGDSCPEGCVFESQRHILDRHFFTYFAEKLYCLFEKEAEDGLFKNIWMLFFKTKN